MTTTPPSWRGSWWRRVCAGARAWGIGVAVFLRLLRVRQDADAMVAARQLLAEDVDAVVERAGALWDFVCPR